LEQHLKSQPDLDCPSQLQTKTEFKREAQQRAEDAVTDFANRNWATTFGARVALARVSLDFLMNTETQSRPTRRTMLLSTTTTLPPIAQLSRAAPTSASSMVPGFL
jgi:carbohydrate-binding DOMON domain-containing protein